jgi:hypothetical protein
MFNRYEFESYDLDQISSIQFTKGFFQGRIQITSFNDYKTIKWVDNNEGKNMTTMVQKAVHDLKQKKSENGESDKKQKSNEDDILNILKLRYSKGEITKKEYDELKKELT